MRSLLCSVLLLTACGTTTRFAATNPSPKPLRPVPAEAVAVFSAGVPDRPFAEIGIVQARQSSDLSLHEMPEILEEMRAEAGRRGCEGLVLNGSSDKQMSSTTVSRRGYSSTSTSLEGYWGTCIVFVDFTATAEHKAP